MSCVTCPIDIESETHLKNLYPPPYLHQSFLRRSPGSNPWEYFVAFRRSGIRLQLNNGHFNCGNGEAIEIMRGRPLAHGHHEDK